ncbi:unnamed protein product [Symbiodinium necroappetens]|uniref:Uncharacterized protein n=1 Tax=Symbiodinium necroappetens TaxID=1628268 RepID=A0A812U2F2_9DINO|nr:unnamed protein product [Symbiodinium necroappetens]
MEATAGSTFSTIPVVMERRIKPPDGFWMWTRRPRKHSRIWTRTASVRTRRASMEAMLLHRLPRLSGRSSVEAVGRRWRCSSPRIAVTITSRSASRPVPAGTEALCLASGVGCTRAKDCSAAAQATRTRKRPTASGPQGLIPVQAFVVSPQRQRHRLQTGI